MSIDPFSGRNPSYCFVDLDENEDIDTVIQRLRGYPIRGRPIKINYDAGKRQQRTPRRFETRSENGERRCFDFTLTEKSPLIFDRYARTDAREHWSKPVEENRRLFVGGLSDISDQAFVNEEMRQLFHGHDIQAVSKRILPAHRNMAIAATGQCYCFVDLPSAREAAAAMAALDGRPTPYGGFYKINIAYVQHDRKVCREQAGLLGSHRVTGEVKRSLDGNWRSRG
jgi:RNA recognition motif-containing protein